MLDQVLDRAYQYLAHGGQNSDEVTYSEGLGGQSPFSYYIPPPRRGNSVATLEREQEDTRRQRSSRPNHPWARPKPKSKTVGNNPQFEAANRQPRAPRASSPRSRQQDAPPRVSSAQTGRQQPKPNEGGEVLKAYAFLGLKKGAVKIEDVKGLRKKLAFRYHSDKGGDESVLKEVNAAVDCVLKDLAKKI